MPIEVVPHMYRMLADEIQWACDDGEPYHFDHFLLLSRTYILSDDEADATLATPQHQKRRKGAPTPSAVGGVSTFHHEDLLIQQVCLALSMHAVRLEGNKPYSKLSSNSLDYDLSNASPRDKDSFGIQQGGRLMLFPASHLPQLVANLAAAFPQKSQ
jgi:protein BCP1